MIFLVPGDFIIFSISIEDSEKWPDNKPTEKHFVGQVSRIYGKLYTK